jgi:hypothetical protein
VPEDGTCPNLLEPYGFVPPAMASAVGVCENCVAGNLLDGEPSGNTVSGAYFAPASGQTPSATTTDDKKCIILLTDAFGLPIKNNAILADKIAARMGLDVWVPDIFDGRIWSRAPVQHLTF